MPPRPSPTHFLCIPLVTGASRHQLSTNLAAFSADVTSPDSFAVPEQAVRPLGTLHLTLGVMSFPKDEGLEKAVQLLKTLIPRQLLTNVLPPPKDAATNDGKTTASATATPASEPLGPPPPLLPVTLQGLHSMQAASKATVLYTAPIDPEGTLMRFCEKLRSAFQEAELMTVESRPLLLHATIVNTIYVKGRAKGKKRHDKLTIDARGILERYDDYVWMQDVPVEKIAICKMGAKEQADGDTAYERKGGSQALRSTSSSRTPVVAAPPRAQLSRPASSSPSRKSETEQPYGHHGATSQDGGAGLAAGERESTLCREKDDQITKLEHELEYMKAEVEKYPKNESDTASLWQSKYSSLNHQFLRTDTELRLLRTEMETKEGERNDTDQQIRLLLRDLEQKDAEIRSLRGHVSGLKQWVSASTKKNDQTSDEEIGETMANLRNGLQNWVVSHFRRSKINLEKADQMAIDELADLVPPYEELVSGENKLHLLLSVVSTVLVEDIFGAYFVGLPPEQAARLAQVEGDLASMAPADEVNQWRATTMALLRSGATSSLQQETAAVTEAVLSRINRVLDAITDTSMTDARNHVLRVHLSNAIGLARLLVTQKAVFEIIKPKVLAHESWTFDAETMDHVGEEDEDALTSRRICCVTFPGLKKTGDENGSCPQLQNVVAKARVLCFPD
ncbi:RNA ligase-like domain-containing protein [Xylariomycetidae sp. FL0641]|nr:RNA ligase-like domain-containing protein [Xylariomycetidae sp. FL0641]